MKGSTARTRTRHSTVCPSTNLKSQIAHLPEQPGVYLFSNEARRDDLRRQGAVAARPRPQLSGRARPPSEDRRAARRSRRPRSHRHRLGRRGARAREQPHQGAVAEVQHPAARRQELSVPAADDQRSVSARARRAQRRARRQLLRRPVHAGVARAPDDGADAPVVRHPLVQRGDHRQPRAAVPRVRHQAVHRAVRRGDLLARSSTREAVQRTQLFFEGKNDELDRSARRAR